MKNLSLIPVAGQRARAMPTSDFFGGPVAGFPWLGAPCWHSNPAKSSSAAGQACHRRRWFGSRSLSHGDEKINAMFEAGASLMAGATAATVIGRYREHVAANAKRLSAV